MLDVVVEEIGPEHTHVTIDGELDLNTAARLRATMTALLNRGGVSSISLEATGVSFIDSAGVGTLVVAQRICAAVGVRFSIVAASDLVTKVLTVTGVAQTLGLPAEPQLAGATD